MLSTHVQMLDSVGDVLGKTSEKVVVEHQRVSSEFSLQALVEREGQEACEATQPIQVEVYEPPVHLVKSRKEVEAKQFLHKVDESPSSEKNEDASPVDKVKKLLYQLCIDSKPLNANEKQYLIGAVKLELVRQAVADFFTTFVTPRKIAVRDCFYSVGAAVRAMLDVLQEDYMGGLKELCSIMVASQMLFYVDGNKKITLSQELDNCALWADSEMWKACLQRQINLKFQDAVLALEKQQKETEERERKEKETGLIGFFKKVAAEIPNKNQKAKTEEPKTTMRISKTIAQNIVFNC